MYRVFVERIEPNGGSILRHNCRNYAEVARIVASAKQDQAGAPAGTDVQVRIERVQDTLAQKLIAFTVIEAYLLARNTSRQLRDVIGMVVSRERYGVTLEGLMSELAHEYPAGFYALSQAPKETQERIVTAIRKRLERERPAVFQTSGQ